jgi:Cytochrome oxidase assembly protein
MISAVMRNSLRRLGTRGGQSLSSSVRLNVAPVFIGNGRLQRRFSANSRAEPEEVDTELINDTESLEETSSKAQLVHPEFRRRVGIWLLVCAGAVLGMIVLGGYTRLSKSGLSMTRWKPIQYQYPTTDAKWAEEFEHYKVPAAH